MKEHASGGQNISYLKSKIKGHRFHLLRFQTKCTYSAVSNKRAGSNKQAGKDKFFIQYMKNYEQGGKICNLLYKNLRAG